MAENNDRYMEPASNILRVGHLPKHVTAKDISTLFEIFGETKKLYLKRRVSKDSPVLLPNPYVILVFYNSETIDQIMASRPFYIGDNLLSVRRFIPHDPNYPDEPFVSVKKMLIRIPPEQNDQILPDDQSIVEYLLPANGNILFFERLDDKTVLIQFDDYDPVDVCCLSRPHFINNQPILIEKCTDEERVREQIISQKLNFSPSSTGMTESMNTVSPAPILSIDDQMIQLQSTYNEMTNRFEDEHTQLITSLSEEWKQTAKERIRLQRLTLDYRQEFERIQEENRKLKKLFSESIKEKPLVQAEGERKLKEASQEDKQ